MKKFLVFPVLALLCFFSCQKETTHPNGLTPLPGAVNERTGPVPVPECPCWTTLTWNNAAHPFFSGAHTIKIYKRTCGAPVCTLGPLVATLTKASPTVTLDSDDLDCGTCFTAVANAPVSISPVLRVADVNATVDYTVYDSGTCVAGRSRAFSITCIPM